MPSMQLRLSRPQFEALEAVREKTGVSLSEQIRKILDEWLANTPTLGLVYPPAGEGHATPAADPAPPLPTELHEVPAFLARPAPSRFSRGVKIKRR